MPETIPATVAVSALRVRSGDFSLLALVTLVIFCLPSLAQAAARVEKPFDDCIIGNDVASMNAQCATVSVPLDPAAPDDRRIELHVARLAARDNAPAEDPFTLLAGGPGQSATESFPTVAFAFAHIQRTRDIILVDQRGTGDSHRLDCPDKEHSSALSFDAEEIIAASRECHDQIDVDTRFFTSSVAVRDLDAVREVLGITQWNVYGISYGTRVAAHYARRYPERVRTLILDAVVPPQHSLGPDIALTAQRALEQLFTRCEQDDGCNSAFPQLRSRTFELLASLKKKPRSVSFEDIRTGELRTIEFSDKHLAVTLRLLSYTAHGNAILPSMLYDSIENGNFAPLARSALLQAESLDSSLAGGMHNAVICTEDEPFIGENPDIASLQETYLGSELLQAMQANCSVWPQGVIDDDFKQPLSVNVPTLVMSGSDDPITPPGYGEQVASSLADVVHIVNQDQAHMQAPLGCIPSLMASFVTNASSNELPLQCLKRLRAPAFFVDANGPLP